MAGLHSRSRNATLEARVSVMPWPPTRVEHTISCGPSSSWKASTAASRAGTESSPTTCAASGKRWTSASWISRWPAKTTSGSSEARKSSIQARAAAELLQPAEDAQLGDQLVRVVHHRRSGQRQLERALGQRLGEPAHGAR